MLLAVYPAPSLLPPSSPVSPCDAHTCSCMNACMPAEGQPLPLCTHTSSIFESLSLSRNFSGRLGWLVSKPTDPLVCLPRAQITDTGHYVRLFPRGVWGSDSGPLAWQGKHLSSRAVSPSSDFSIYVPSSLPGKPAEQPPGTC